MTGFELPMMKTLCLAFFLIFVFYRSILSASTVCRKVSGILALKSGLSPGIASNYFMLSFENHSSTHWVP
jgi:hypothetical protein